MAGAARRNEIQDLRKKLFGGFTAALIGYMWGWIWGWSLFDPNLDLWALLAAIGTVVGLVAGLLGLFWRKSAMLLCATLGLYLGWVLRTWIFGDKPGGRGIMLMALAVLCGVWMAWAYRLQQQQSSVAILLSVLFIGFFGGFTIDVLMPRLVNGAARPHTILTQAPWVIACGALGGMISVCRARQIERIKNP
jgi:hypothetical protein